MLALAIVVVGIISRLIFHTANFTPVLALALFAGLYLNKRLALIVPLGLMIFSDFLLGMHTMILFTWGSILLIAVMGGYLKDQKSVSKVFVSSITAAVIFFVLTNFGVWLLYYPKTMPGLVNCFYMAVPFFRSTFASTIVFSMAFYGLYEGAASLIRKSPRLAKVLLTT